MVIDGKETTAWKVHAPHKALGQKVEVTLPANGASKIQIFYSTAPTASAIHRLRQPLPTRSTRIYTQATPSTHAVSCHAWTALASNSPIQQKSRPPHGHSPGECTWGRGRGNYKGRQVQNICSNNQFQRQPT